MKCHETLASRLLNSECLQSERVDLKREIDRLIADGQPRSAARRLNELWRGEASPSAAAFLVSRYEQLREHLGLLPYRIALLRSFTVEPVVPLLRAEAFVLGMDLQVHVGGFNAYAQEILDAGSSLYGYSPDAVILAMLAHDVAPDLTHGYADLTPEGIDLAVERVTGSFRDWVRAFRSHSHASLIVPTLEQQAVPSLGVLDAQSEHSQAQAIARINRDLQHLGKDHRGVYVLDYDGLVARHGRLRWRDERKWQIARMPIAADHLIHLAREWMRFLVPLSGKTVKALAVDLDNTLWGGVIGEEGMNGIQLGAEHPGVAYQSLQRTLLDLSRRGIVLAICSKNNAEEAMEALERHPGMLVRPRDFASMRINWEDKAQNLREIAGELNIGIDALAFMDDNPVECERIRTALPEVTVIELSGDPAGYAGLLRNCPVFERLAATEEDGLRTSLYASQAERSQAAQRFESKEDFYRFLEQEVEIAGVGPDSLARVAQLTQKTNQFNVTTRRYSEAQISALAAAPDCQVLSIRVRDRYGDQGIVGVAITRDHEDDCEIDTLLLSCRVIGRTVETAFLCALAQRALSRNRRTLVGRFVPTKKNAPARDFYVQHGFELVKQDGEESHWMLDLTRCPPRCPDWITLRLEDEIELDAVSAGSKHSR
jgi:FkbH-like protein